MAGPNYKYRHILLTGTSSTERFTSPQSGRSQLNFPLRTDRQAHCNYLRSQLNQAHKDLDQLKRKRKEMGTDPKTGITLAFQGEPGYDLKFESLDLKKSGIELLSVREIGHEGKKTTFASVHVPDGKLKTLLKKVEKYGSEETLKGKPRNQPLVESISSIRKAVLEELWTDEIAQFPGPGETIWWEVWLRSGKNNGDILDFFRTHAPGFGLKLKNQEIQFPDRTVILAYGSQEDMAKSLDLLNCIAELRKAKESPEFFMKLPRNEQQEWVEEALDRIETSASDDVSICILDTGVSRKHPLIAPHLSESDMHTYDDKWFNFDHDGHGTQMAGLAIYGDLLEVLSANSKFQVPYRLESVKMLPPPPRKNEPELYGAITSGCISRAEIEAPWRKRVLSMAVTALDFRDRGQPSSWSAAIDNICSGAEDEGRRLMVISAGNTEISHRHLYPDNNFTEGIHDPGQAWNALCIGAYTGKSIIDQNDCLGWKPIAPPGDLSPSSTTSLIWERRWPLKPDIVFEGGNNALLPSGKYDNGPDSLGLLTTHHRPMEKLFAICGDTSAATAQVARMAAIIQAEYPEFWPETIRALLVHSAEWTPAMKARWGQELNSRGREGMKNLIRCCGFGVPNLARARRSAENALTLIIQDSLQPYDKKDNRCITRDMHIHKILWPSEVLKEMGDIPVSMQVTLSYFIEPNPARRGWRTRYGYASHQLRFDVKTPTETMEQFRKRINKAAREEEEESETSSDSAEWELGPKLRHKGSIHSDRWQGTAIDLAERGYIGVYPVSGWWKERHRHERWDREARYALIVSIETPDVDVDLYTAVANLVGITVTV